MSSGHRLSVLFSQRPDIYSSFLPTSICSFPVFPLCEIYAQDIAVYHLLWAGRSQTKTWDDLGDFQIQRKTFYFRLPCRSLTISIQLLIHFSTHLWHHPHSRHPSLLHSFTPGSKPIFSTNPFHRIDFFYLLDCLTITGLDRTYHARHFIFSFAF